MTPPWLTVDEMRFWRAFLESSGRVLQYLDSQLKSHSDLTLDDYDVLVHLSEAPDHRLRMSDLSMLLLHSQSRVTQRVDRLTRRGLVVREKSTSDGRVTYAVLTPVGLSSLEDAAQRHVVDVRKSVIDSVEPGELRAAIRVLERIAHGARPTDHPEHDRPLRAS